MQAIKKQTENADQATEIQIKHHTNLQFLHNSLLFRVTPSQRETRNFKICKPTLVRGEKKHWFDDFIVVDQSALVIRQ